MTRILDHITKPDERPLNAEATPASPSMDSGASANGRDELEDLRRQLTDNKIELATETGEKKAMVSQITRLEAALQESVIIRREMKLEMKLESVSDALHKERDEARAKVAVSAAEIGGIESAKAVSDALRKERDEVQAKLAASETEIEGMRAKVASMEKQAATDSVALETLRKTINKLNTELASVKKVEEEKKKHEETRAKLVNVGSRPSEKINIGKRICSVKLVDQVVYIGYIGGVQMRMLADVGTVQKTFTFPKNENVYGLDVDDTLVYASSGEGTFYAWNRFTDTRVFEDNKIGPSYSMLVKHSKIFVAAGQWVNIYETKNGQVTNTGTKLSGHTQWVKSIASDNTCIITGAMDDKIIIWTLSGQKKQTLNGHTDTVYGLCIFNDKIFSASYDKTLRVWSMKTNQESKSYSLDEECRRMVKRGSFLYLGGYMGYCAIWDAKQVENCAGTAMVSKITGHSSWVFGVDVSDEIVVTGDHAQNLIMTKLY